VREHIEHGRRLDQAVSDRARTRSTVPVNRNTF
jgi:hypothetical protein